MELLIGRAAIELQRVDLAERFGCAPSQINYVLVTRFTPARGFMVESRRGGGGYIRLVRLPAEARATVPDQCDQATAEQHVARLRDAGRLTVREAAILRAVVAREVLSLPLPLRDRIRAAVLRAGVCAALRAVTVESGGEGPAIGSAGSPAGAQTAEAGGRAHPVGEGVQA